MRESQPEALASILSELLLYASALGRGFRSPFEPINGMVFTSALPIEAAKAMTRAELRFRNWHTDTQKSAKQDLERLKSQPKTTIDSPEAREKIKKLEEQVSKLPYVTWDDEKLSKADMVDMLQKSYYGAFTFFDRVGGRLAGSISGAHNKLSADLSLVTLTEGTISSTLIRANGTGGANIHSLASTEPIFHYFSSVRNESGVYKLQDRIKNSSSGLPGMGNCVLIPGQRGKYTGVSDDTLNSLMMRVYAKGNLSPEKRIGVFFDHESEEEWQKFLAWDLREIIGEEGDLAEWQIKMANESPASPKLSVLFAARAALTRAFIEVVQINPRGGPIDSVFLSLEHLEMAKRFAKLIYYKSSGYDKYEIKLENLKNRSGKVNYITLDKLATARRAMEEALSEAELGKITRTHVRTLPGVTYGLLDELVRRGEIIELQGTDQCRMGKTTRAYVLPSAAPGYDEEEAYAEFVEAMEMFNQDPEITPDREAYGIYRGVREKAQDFYNQYFLPAVPLSKLSHVELQALPKLLDMWPNELLIRGKDHIAEPPKLMDDETPLDINGCNLWVRRRPDGQEFCDWNEAGKLKLGEFWGVSDGEEKKPMLRVVPA